MIRRFFRTMAALQQHLTNSTGQIKDVPQSGNIFGPKNSKNSQALLRSFSEHLDSLNWLHEFAPHFAIAGDAITVIEEPSDFYETILRESSAAKRRVVLASLYLGIGELEQQLVNGLLENMKANPELTVDILLDFQRGTRGAVNSKTTLKPLLDLSTRFNLSLYHTPNLRGAKKRFIPARWNELIGLQHMKVDLFDDSVIISGANLSQDYFTNRQDRYIMIRDKRLSDFYSGLVHTVQEFSLRVDNANQEQVLCHPQWTSKQMPFDGDHRSFIRAARNKVLSYCERTRDEQGRLWREEKAKGTQQAGALDTFVFPLIEMGQLEIHHDSVVTRRIFQNALQQSKIKLASGYFNLTEELVAAIIDHSQADCSILMAHPNANGFKGAKGPAGGIPDAYSLLACQFQENYKGKGKENRIHLFEYEKPDWTYHAKGLWYHLPGDELPSMTLIGSSNFGERSVNRDLESQVCIVTASKSLQRRLHRECERLFSVGSPAEEAITVRAIPRWVRAVVHQFRNFF